MKKFIFIAFFTALSAFAGNEGSQGAVFNYTFFGNTAGRYTMVACDYATPLAQKWMEALGAKDVSVQCSGGIQPYGVFPLNLRATYTAPVLTGTTRTAVFTIESGTFPGDSNCDFDTSLMGALLADFSNAHVTGRRDGCFNSDSPYRYDLSVTLPQ
jgi:hypothetical protein